ncbi:MAG TPA: hydrogenase [Azospirillum sp.]
MSHPLIEQLCQSGGCVPVTPDSADAFLAPGGAAVLFFTGDPAQRPESSDVAVILRELIAAFPGRFRAAVVDRDAGEVLKKRWNVVVFPALVVLRDGAPIDIIARVQDWPVYVERLRAALDGAPSLTTH